MLWWLLTASLAVAMRRRPAEPPAAKIVYAAIAAHVQVYDASKPINLQDLNLFLEYDKTDTIKVSETVTRKFIYLNDLMTVIVDFNNGPMAEPDPFHSHPAEQVSYVAIGECDVYIGDQPVKHLKTGDIFAVPSNVPHTVKSTTKQLRLVDSFTPIREDFIRK